MHCQCHCRKKKVVVNDPIVFTKPVIFNDEVQFNSDIILGGIIRDRQGNILVGQGGIGETPFPSLPLTVTAPGDYVVTVSRGYTIATEGVRIHVTSATPRFDLGAAFNQSHSVRIIPEIGQPVDVFVNNRAPLFRFVAVCPQPNGSVTTELYGDPSNRPDCPN